MLSRNPNKLMEIRQYLTNLKTIEIKATYTEKEINEIQTADVNALINDKLLKAFNIVKAPVIVEHTGLYLDELNGFPGGLTQPFWDKLQKEKFCHYFGGTSLTAKTTLGFCDGKKKHFFTGEVKGKVATKPEGNDKFQWDCVFIPDGYNNTFAELGDEKLKISMRTKAFQKLQAYLEGTCE